MSEWTNDFKNPISYLLAEDGSYLLAEDSTKLALEETGQGTSTWSNDSKN